MARGVEPPKMMATSSSDRCVLCHKYDGVRVVPVQADFTHWDPAVDGRHDAPAWYVNTRINNAIKPITKEGEGK
jgi:hypothetical protein